MKLITSKYSRVFFSLLFLIAGTSISARAQFSAYVTNSGSNNVSVINTTTNAVIATVPVGNGPAGLAVAPNGSQVYVTNVSDNTVSVVSTATNRVVARVTVGNAPQAVAFTPNGVFAYVSNSGDNTVSVISTATNTVAATVNLAPYGDTGPNAVVVAPSGAYAYVVNAQTVSVISTATNTVTATISVPAGAGSTDGPGVSITPSGLFLYVSGGEGQISVVSTQTNAVIDVFYPPTGYVRGSEEEGIAIAPSGAVGYAAVGGFSYVEVFDTTTNSATTTQIPVGSFPTGVAISPDGAYVYVTDYGSGTVSVIQVATNTVAATINVGNQPGAVAITPAVCNVTDNSDDPSDPGSLRYCVNNAVSGEVVNFANSLNGQTITLSPAYGPLTVTQNLFVQGPGPSLLSISGGNAVGVFSIGSPTTVTIFGLTIENGTTAGTGGGGIYNAGTLNLSNSTLSNNSSYGSNGGSGECGCGGGIFNDTGGTLTVANTTISGGYVRSYSGDGNGGGIFNNTGATANLSNSTVSGNVGSVGGGIVNNGTLTIANSNLSGNNSLVCCGGGVGGGIYIGAGTVTISNTTISGNAGFGIFNGGYTYPVPYPEYAGGTLVVSDSTIANNIGGDISNFAVATLTNSILALGQGQDCYQAGGTFISDGYNLVDDNSCSFAGIGDLNNTPAGLDPNGPQNNGGPTQTVLPLPGSAAICAGSASLTPAAITTDQRGFPRLNTSYTGYNVGDPCLDIGAVQTNYQSVQFTNAEGGYSGNVNQAISPAPVVSVTENGQNIGDVPVTLAFSGAGVATGLGPAATVAGAGATFSSLSVNMVGSGDTLSATLPVVGAYSLSASTSLTIAYPTSTIISAPAITYGNAAQVTVTVSSTAGTVTGNVSLTVDNGSPLIQRLSNGQAVFTITGLGGGTHNLGASFTTQGTFLDSSGTGTLQVNKAQPTVTFTGASTTAPYESTFTVVASTNASTSAVITASGVCIVAGTAVTITAPAGTCVLTANWAADSNYLAASATQSTTATKATPTINWATPAPIMYGTALSDTQLDATATYNRGIVAGKFVYTPTKGTVLTAGMQTLSVSFSPTDTTDYTAASGSVTLQVNQATPTIKWPTPAAITYGTALSGTQLDATTSIQGSFAYSPAAATVLTAGKQTLTVSFTPTDTVDYSSPTDSVSITVKQAAPTVSWTTPAPITYGTGLSSAQLNATASVPGTFVFSPAAGAIEAGGTDKLSATFTPTDSVDYTTATASVTLQVNAATPTINWPTPAPITYGAALTGTQLDATATFNGSNVAGTYTYTPAKGTVLGAGAQTLSVSFTPTNTANYTATGVTITLQVNQATPQITWAKPAAITYGTALSITQLDATASVSGSPVYSPALGTYPNGGTDTLSVTFTPTDTTDYTTATDSVSLTVNPTASTTTITDTPNPSTVNQAVTVAFTVSGLGGTPTGTVTVSASTGETCSGTLTGGTGSCMLTLTSPGSPKLTATYGGDSNFKSSTSAKVTQTVQQ